MTTDRWERGATRAAAGLSLLLMLACPLSVIATVWTSDPRWLVSGFVLGLAGLGIGVVIRDEAQKRATR